MESLRVYYVERQRLAADDLRAEQDYLRGLDRRHDLGLHAPGVVRGLRVAEEGGRYRVEPGVAVDPYGRELILQPEPFDIGSDNKCADVWLAYCRQPLRPRAPGRAPCSAQDSPRWREAPRVLVVETERGAAPQAPADGAVFLGRIKGPAPADLVGELSLDVAYTALRGREVGDPAGRASMQVGPRHGRDSVAFAVGVADDSGLVVRRVELDRRGGNTLTGTLELLNDEARAVVPVLESAGRLLAEAVRRGPAGEQIQVKAEEIREGDVRITKLTFLNLSREPGLPESETLILRSDSPDRNKALADFNKTSRLVRIKLLPPAKKAGRVSGRRGAGRGEDDAQASVAGDVPLVGSGGTLEFDETQNAVGAGAGRAARDARRGCYDRDDSAAAEPARADAPTGLSFRPAEQPPKGQPLPRIYLAQVRAGDRVVEQLRLDLGEKKDADDSTRFSLRGGEPPDPKIEDWLTFSGKCLLSVNGITVEPDDPNDEKKPPVSMDVRGSIEQAPVKPDPTDPIFRNLLVVAWLEGLRSSLDASTVIAVDIEGEPPVVESGRPWAYKVRLTNSSNAEVGVERLFETLKVGGSSFFKLVTPQAKVPANNSLVLDMQHEGQELPAGNMTVEVMASGKAANLPWWDVGPQSHDPIQVVLRPEIDLSDVPETVPPNTAWEHSFKVRNTSARHFMLYSVVLEETDRPPVELLSGPRPIDPQREETFGPFSHSGVAAQSVDLTLTIHYEWSNDLGGLRSLPKLRTINVGAPHLVVRATPPLSVTRGEPWDFSVSLENVGDEPLTITSLLHGLTSPPGTSVPDAEVTLEPGGVGDLGAIPGTIVSSAETQVTQFVAVRYEYAGREWRPRPVQTPISVAEPEE